MAVDLPVDPIAAGFRRALRRLAGGVTLLTTRDAQGQPHGMAATAVVSVTMEPPTLIACVNRSASLHGPLLARGAFCVNLLGPEHAALVEAFSGKLAGAERFGLGRWADESGTTLPGLADAQAVLVCAVDETLTRGSHTVVVARVEGVRVGAGPVSALVYADGALGGVAPLTVTS